MVFVKSLTIFNSKIKKVIKWGNNEYPPLLEWSEPEEKTYSVPFVLKNYTVFK